MYGAMLWERGMSHSTCHKHKSCPRVIVIFVQDNRLIFEASDAVCPRSDFFFHYLFDNPELDPLPSRARHGGIYTLITKNTSNGIKAHVWFSSLSTID